ncbi:hypothetical protein D3C85_1879260 [compost metagenome]
MLELSSIRLVRLQILMAITLKVASTQGMARAIKLYSIGKCKLKSQPHKIGPRIAPIRPTPKAIPMPVLRIGEG